jgi:phosphomethylpyrimidine synthase
MATSDGNLLHALDSRGRALHPHDAEAGMAEMSEKFRERGGEIYLPAAE